MLAAGANPIFAHTSLLGCLEVESEASNERFFPRPSAIESAAVAGQGSILVVHGLGSYDAPWMDQN